MLYVVRALRFRRHKAIFWIICGKLPPPCPSTPTEPGSTWAYQWAVAMELFSERMERNSWFTIRHCIFFRNYQWGEINCRCKEKGLACSWVDYTTGYFMPNCMKTIWLQAIRKCYTRLIQEFPSWRMRLEIVILSQQGTKPVNQSVNWTLEKK